MSIKYTKRRFLLPTLIITLAIVIMSITTFAFLRDNISDQSSLELGKIQLSINIPYTTTIELTDVVPGDKITDKISIQKDVSSDNMYIRAKIWYTTSSSEPAIQDIVNDLNSRDNEVSSYGDYLWSEKYDNFYYLMQADAKYNAYEISSTNEIVFSEGLYFPLDIEFPEGNLQYMESVSLHIEFQAIQSYNVSDGLIELNTLFGDLFGESAEIADPANFTFSGTTLTGLSVNGKKLSRVVIPKSYSRVDGKYVLGDDYVIDTIGSRAFMSNNVIQSVKMYDNIEYIEDLAFYICENLCNIELSNNLKLIEYHAFSSTNISGIYLPYGLESIGDYAFMRCYELQKVNIPTTVASIGRMAFYSCNSLETVVFEGDNMNNLFLGEDAFYTGDTIKSVYVNNIESWLSLSFDNAQSSPLKESSNLLVGGEILVDVIVPENIREIGNFAFYNCRTLQSIKLHNDITKIGSYAFYRTRLAEITIPSSVQEIGGLAFSGCGLKKLFLSSGLKHIGNLAFYNCSVQEVHIPDIESWLNIEFNGDKANPICTYGNLYVDGCLLTNLIIPEGVKQINDYAFYNCNLKGRVILPDSLVDIGYNSFTGCDGITFNQYDNAYYLGSLSNPYFILIKAISTDIVSCDINDNTKVIDASAFQNCTSLLDVVIPEGVFKVGTSAFSGCTALTNISIPNTITEIGSGAFANCYSLIFSEYNNAYYLGNETNEHFILYKAKNTSIDSCVIHPNTKIIYAGAFSSCLNLKSFELIEGIVSIGASAFYRAGITSIKIPSTVVSIGSSAFSEAQIASIEFADDSQLKTMGSNAFDNCRNLTELRFPNSMEELGSFGYQCTSLTNITLPENVDEISLNLYACSELRYIVFYNNVKDVNLENTSTCSKFESVYFMGTLEEWGGITFNIRDNDYRIIEADRYYIDFIGESSQDKIIDIKFLAKDTDETDDYQPSSIVYSSDTNAIVDVVTGEVTFVGENVTSEITATITMNNGDIVTTSYTAIKSA